MFVQQLFSVRSQLLSCKSSQRELLARLRLFPHLYLFVKVYFHVSS